MSKYSHFITWRKNQHTASVTIKLSVDVSFSNWQQMALLTNSFGWLQNVLRQHCEHENFRAWVIGYRAECSNKLSVLCGKQNKDCACFHPVSAVPWNIVVQPEQSNTKKHRMQADFKQNALAVFILQIINKLSISKHQGCAIFLWTAQTAVSQWSHRSFTTTLTWTFI